MLLQVDPDGNWEPVCYCPSNSLVFFQAGLATSREYVPGESNGGVRVTTDQFVPSFHSLCHSSSS